MVYLFVFLPGVEKFDMPARNGLFAQEQLTASRQKAGREYRSTTMTTKTTRTRRVSKRLLVLREARPKNENTGKGNKPCHLCELPNDQEEPFPVFHFYFQAASRQHTLLQCKCKTVWTCKTREIYRLVAEFLVACPCPQSQILTLTKLLLIRNILPTFVCESFLFLQSLWKYRSDRESTILQEL